MDANEVLLWVAGISLILTALQASRSQGSELIAMAVGIAIASATCYLIAPGVAGYVAFALYGVVILLPGVLAAAFQSAIDRRRWRTVRLVAILLRLVRPTAAMRLFTGMGLATARAEVGDLTGAERLLRAAPNAPTAGNRATEVWRLHLTQRWEELLSFVDAVDAGDRIAEPVLSMYRIRALGEMGRPDDLVREYGVLEASGALAHPRVRHLVWVSVLAFGGRRAALAKLMLRHPSTAHADRAAFWLATASWAAGDADGARAELAALDAEAGPAIRAAIVNRLAHLSVAATEGPLHELAGRMERVVAAMPPVHGRPWVTLGLIATNLIVFLITMGWDHERAQMLFTLGVFEPSAVNRGEWWRLGSCLFLHANSLHLLMNMLGLYLLGRGIEPRLGRARYAALYGACGLAGTWMAYVLYLAEPGRLELLVGASGSVMGLVGALGILALRDWRAGVGSRRQVEVVVVMVILQIAFDLTHPQVSGTAHLVGLGAGALLAAGVGRR
ncbi:MAG: rhomboid family intramembrane serine protease [Planctomycetes bacterium]|nr:rhomboid family intramembrane serine protease [Planctomycetota bacterium]